MKCRDIPIFKVLFFTIFLIIFVTANAFAGETITAREIEGYFYADGKMERSEGLFENTYYFEDDQITRTRVYDFKKKKIIPDDTIYKIQRQLWSDPTQGLSIIGVPIIRAIGQPGKDAIEILIIGEKYIQSIKSTADYLVISRFERID